MASNDNFDMAPGAAKALIACVIVGAIVFNCAVFALGGAILGSGFALYYHSWAIVGWAALAGAGVGLLNSLWTGFKGFINGRIQRGKTL